MSGSNYFGFNNDNEVGSPSSYSTSAAISFGDDNTKDNVDEQRNWKMGTISYRSYVLFISLLLLYDNYFFIRSFSFCANSLISSDEGGAGFTALYCIIPQRSKMYWAKIAMIQLSKLVRFWILLHLFFRRTYLDQKYDSRLVFLLVLTTVDALVLLKNAPGLL